MLDQDGCGGIPTFQAVFADGGQLVKREGDGVDGKDDLGSVHVFDLNVLNGDDVEDEEAEEVGILDDGTDLGHFETGRSAQLRNEQLVSSPVVVQKRRLVGVVHLNGTFLVVLRGQ